jgi:hypothetical protein
MDEPFDIERESYASLVDEATCESAHPWDDSYWDAEAVKHAKAYAAKHELPWPPGRGDFDRWYDLYSNKELT